MLSLEAASKIFTVVKIGDKINIQLEEFPHGNRPSKEKPQKWYVCVVRRISIHHNHFEIDRITKYGKEYTGYDFSDIIKAWKQRGKLHLIIYDSRSAFGRANIEINRNTTRLKRLHSLVDSQDRDGNYDDRFHEADLQWNYLG